MNGCILTFLLFGLLEIRFADKDCMLADLEKIRTCYHDIYGKDLSAPTGPYLLPMPIFLENGTKEYWKPVCDTKQQLNDCIDADLIKTCYNIDDIKKIPYGSGYYKDDAAKYVIASFIQMDHICDKLFKFSDTDYSCYTEIAPNVIQALNNDNDTCDGHNKTLNSVLDAAYKTCGTVVGCFERQNARLTLCYFDIYCHTCDSISSTNNLIDGLCDDDDDDENSVSQISKIP